MKKYKIPEDLCSKLDTKARAPKNPLEDEFGHPLQTKCFDINGKVLASGGKDGSIFIRQLDDLTNITE